MTRINRMVMHGFKSFARRTELVFDKGYNCVLGPNGSGKSNVLDALCFVLGRGSAKSLRAEKSANLIYNGGKTKKPSKFGEVSIAFDNSQKIFSVDAEEVKITRIIKEDGQSIYKINDKKFSRQEVLNLLAQASIDPDGYNIILQGDIVSLVEMSSLDRRKVIEEISGISIYEEKKEKALHDLEKVDQKLGEAEIILKERQTYLKELEKERNQALKFKDLKDKIDTNKASYLHRQVSEKSKEREKNDQEISEHNKKLQEINAQILEKKKQIEGLKIDIENLSNEIEQKGEREQVQLHKEVESLKISITQTQSKIENFHNEIRRIETRTKELAQENASTLGRMKELEEKRVDLVSYKKKKQSELDLIEKELQGFRKKNDMDNAHQIEREIEALDKDNEAHEKEIATFRVEQQNLLREKDRIEFQLQSIDEKLAKVTLIEKEHQAQLQNLKNLKDHFKKATLELNRCLDEESNISAHLGDARRRLLSIQEQMAKFEARVLSVRESSSAEAAIAEILKLRAKKPGIYGTVSELGQVDKKFSLALEVAAGGKLKEIVVDSDKTAAECIQYLKQNRFGVATFIPLNTIKPALLRPEVADLGKKSGVHGFALDLISYESKFKTVFSYVFGNILVVDSIIVARTLGIGKAKMVTLEGDLCDISGTMKGGSRQLKHGIGFREKQEVEQHKKAAEQLEETMKAMSVYEKQKNELEERIITLRQQKASDEGEIIKLEKSLHLESGDTDLTKNTKADLSVQGKAIDSKLRELETKLRGETQALMKNKMKRQDLRAKISELSNPRLVAELNTFEQKRQQVREAMITAESEITALQNQISMLSPEEEKISSIVKSHQKEKESFLARIKEMEVLIVESKAALSEKEKAAKDFYAKYKQLFAKRSKISEDVTKHEQKVDALRDISRKAEIAMNMVTLENAKVKAELAGLEQEFGQYKGVELDTKKSVAELKGEIDRFEKMVQTFGAVNMKALEIYDTVAKEYNSLIEKKETLRKEKEDVLVLMAEIEEKKKGLFVTTLKEVNDHFVRIFQSLSTKGDAELRLETPEDPLDGGLRILVRLVGTKYLDIRSLSGGEKTLTALAFIFAVQECRPHSFYVLDEVDAALDKHNSEKLSKLIRHYSDKAQYVVISHNDAIISEADTLYGVSMDETGSTKVTSLRV